MIKLRLETDSDGCGEAAAFLQKYLSLDEFKEIKVINDRGCKSNIEYLTSLESYSIQAIKQTLFDLSIIQKIFSTHPWSDVQLLVHKTTGSVTVIDPGEMKMNSAQGVSPMLNWWRSHLMQIIYRGSGPEGPKLVFRLEGG